MTEPTHRAEEEGEQPVRPPHPAGDERPHDPWAPLRSRDFRLYLTGNVLSTVGSQMKTVAIGWELYERTHDPLSLGLVGLAQFVPVALLVLHAGHVADRFERRRIAAIALCVFALASLGLAAVSATGAPVVLVYACLALAGTARAFYGAARGALLPQLVSREHLEQAVRWSSGAWQLASVVGPALGGFAIHYAGRATPVFVFDALTSLGFAAMMLSMRSRQAVRSTERATLHTLLAGVRFLTRTPVLLGAIALDMFAVLLGGATALLPVYARDILHVGPRGLGWLEAAPAIGAVVMAGTLAASRPFGRAGTTLFWAVGGFGLATVAFGLSRSFALSLAALVVLGAMDNVSVVIRSSLLQLATPDEMRGRVASVNSLFIGASNELGGFESGLVARLVGPVFSVVSGGVGTILVVLLVARRWPELRRLRRLEDATA